ncbi:MAG TPA: hypothetical protein DCG12_20635 [Planctomycetaceae bacterium]|nr:hypothetical protein [Planctomycetaceae bacterium]
MEVFQMVELVTPGPKPAGFAATWPARESSWPQTDCQTARPALSPKFGATFSEFRPIFEMERCHFAAQICFGVLYVRSAICSKS